MLNTRRFVIMLLLAAAAGVFHHRVGAQATPEYDAALDRYVQRVGFLVRQNLDLRFVRSTELEAVASIRFSEDGKFIGARIEERSGDPAFDMALESAIRRSIPILPPPPIPPQVSGPFAIRILVR